ncbi:uncharacterized protein Dwil_GK25478 [Drosophila willistoni]|uniref:Transmembrane protein n=1 Tax=Drosophila willistoni TaxID=7260 RepID=B4NDM8_DROWI|nr:uncharacterized protein LOC6648451 [Drosophila willistoni]EDW81850.2 uncharacterized protein Dwil_GK25478 [Drosophila willistoni]
MTLGISQYNFDLPTNRFESLSNPYDASMGTYHPFYAIIPHRSNLILQMLLQANCIISILWSSSYLLNMVIYVNDLYNANGLGTLAAYVVAVISEMVRLYAGYSINLCTGATAQWLVLTLTPCILLPAMVYLRLLTFGHVFYLSILSNVLFLMIALEILVAILHFICCKPMNKTKWHAKEYTIDDNSMDLVSQEQSSQRTGKS